MVSVLAAAVPLGLDPAVWSGDPAGHFTTALGWNEYLTRFFDPSLEEQQEPEICKILGQATEPSLKEIKEASSKRFAVCASPLPARARHACTESSRVGSESVCSKRLHRPSSVSAESRCSVRSRWIALRALAEPSPSSRTLICASTAHIASVSLSSLRLHLTPVCFSLFSSLCVLLISLSLHVSACRT